jgi:hypothetical protein
MRYGVKIFIGALLLTSTALCKTAFASPPVSRPFAHMCEAYASRPGLSIDAVLRSAKVIAVVRVSSAQPNPNAIWIGENFVYSLEVVDVIKGMPPMTIKLPGVRMKWGFPFDPSLFDLGYRHANGFAKTMKVDQTMSTRQQVPLADGGGYCEYAPYFEVGLEYVVVLPEPYTQISFEPIGSFADPWLTVVRGYTDRNPLTGEPLK